jgi:hypothetical protein
MIIIAAVIRLDRRSFHLNGRVKNQPVSCNTFFVPLIGRIETPDAFRQALSIDESDARCKPLEPMERGTDTANG